MKVKSIASAAAASTPRSPAPLPVRPPAGPPARPPVRPPAGPLTRPGMFRLALLAALLWTCIWIQLPIAVPPAGAGEPPQLFHRRAEPNEGAFSLLVPDGWTLEGGIVRIDPTQAGGAAQSIEAKVDLTVKRDEAGTVMLRQIPDWYYCDMRHSPAGQMGMFPTGSNYGGMTVCPVLTAREYLEQIALPQLHPDAQDLRIEEARSLDDLAQGYRRRVAAMVLPMDVAFDAALLTLTYREGGRVYREKIMALIEDRGRMAAGQWANRETRFIRAPAEEFAAWEPVFSLMLGSVKISGQWLAGEIRGSLQRAGIYDRVQRQIQEIDRQITAHRQETNAEIHNDMFLTLTDQEEYIHPYTGEIEVGSNQLGRYRWETESGDVVYSDLESFDPNIKGALNRSDWKRSQVRLRGPGR